MQRLYLGHYIKLSVKISILFRTFHYIKANIMPQNTFQQTTITYIG